jgi:hypothetical protein
VVTATLRQGGFGSFPNIRSMAATIFVIHLSSSMRARLTASGSQFILASPP